MFDIISAALLEILPATDTPAETLFCNESLSCLHDAAGLSRHDSGEKDTAAPAESSGDSALTEGDVKPRGKAADASAVPPGEKRSVIIDQPLSKVMLFRRAVHSHLCINLQNFIYSPPLPLHSSFWEAAWFVEAWSPHNYFLVTYDFLTNSCNMVLQVLTLDQKPTMLSNHAEVRLLAGTRSNPCGRICARKLLSQ